MIVFQNAGEINPTAITTFGVSVKASDSAIGYFGTGLKYAIAVILRAGGHVEIQSGTNRYTFGTITSSIRGKEFEIVTINEAQLGYTLELGKDWEMWQAFRELESNCRDESGESFETDHVDFHGTNLNGLTRIVVWGCPEFEDWFRRKDEIFLDKTRDFGTPRLDVVRSPSSTVFYKTVRVYESQRTFTYTYNFRNGITLTEDRTVKYPDFMLAYIANDIVRYFSTDQLKDVWRDPDCKEFDLDYTSTSCDPSPQFIEYVTKEFAVNPNGVPDSAFALCRKHLLDNLQVETMELSPCQTTSVQRAIKFCRSIGYSVDDYPIVFADDLGPNIMGRAHMKTIYLSRSCIAKGTRFIASTLIEEWAHIKYNYADYTASFQNYLFDEIVRQGEERLGAPL